VDTTILRVLAITLIANSHLEDLYPFRWLAADGLIGNSLFFLLSGLGLALSPRTGEGHFLGWYRRRVSRIYPGLWLTVLVGMVLFQGAWRDWSPLDFVRNLVWPTPYGFIAQIVVFYPAFYLLKALRSPKAERGVLLGLTGPYLIVALFYYNIHILSWIFYFQVMLFGGLLAGRVHEIGRDGRRHLWLLAVTMLAYFVVKLAMVTGRIPSHVGVLHLLTLPILSSLVGLCATPDMQALARLPRLRPALALVAGLTLEIYLVHGFVHTYPRVAMLPFPANLAAFWAATLPLAWFLSAASEQARRLMGSGNRVCAALAAARWSAVRSSPEAPESERKTPALQPLGTPLRSRVRWTGGWR
jgi:peptidoglycan/LPS O-acetylase OafA/YrhL